MKVAIVGSRSFRSYAVMLEFLTEINLGVTHIVSGGAAGADHLAEKLSEDFAIPITIYPANWKKHGKAAGMIRNKQVVNDCEAVVAFPGPDSVGTLSTINLAEAKGIPVYVKEVYQ